ncbi:NAD(P)H-dependent oxidoreductase [Chenggangzhangella methanolivorans]|uniref:NAD(P)H-dependent oxidoreductase n=1 Tax=Chenggangzhangella methanolivorans TaxID=1437009 RepID=A0A9E6R9I4_9HYPH|nr:NAD(P)H-dependent oxidoreductase [Chenggangzhangella methanolivorans]QZO00027.1 NAD(P)H-dependent oxidoreductase [Chenggangzhangella methanolivorans]
MRTLIVLSHPDKTSLTHAVARRIAEAVRSQDPAPEVEVADLAAEGFDPRWSEADIAAYRKQAPAPDDVAAEQARLDEVDALVLVYPVYWWSMPGLLKGWIDRVFNNGWAYDERPDGSVAKLLGRLKIHLVAIGGADEGVYQRHGYAEAMRAQIDHGMFDYCGAPVLSSSRLVPGDDAFPASALERADKIGKTIAGAAVAA